MSKMNKLTMEFIRKSHFYEFNALRVDLDVLFVYNRTTTGKDRVLVWNDGYGQVVDLQDLEDLRLSSKDHEKFLDDTHMNELDCFLDCISEECTGEEEAAIIQEPNHYYVLGLRKQIPDTLSGIETVKKLVFCTSYTVNDDETLNIKNGVFDACGNPIITENTVENNVENNVESKDTPDLEEFLKAVTKVAQENPNIEYRIIPRISYEVVVSKKKEK